MHARTLLTRAELSRKANADPRTVAQVISYLGIEPEAVTGNHPLFAPEVATQIRRELVASAPETLAGV